MPEQSARDFFDQHVQVISVPPLPAKRGILAGDRVQVSHETGIVELGTVESLTTVVVKGEAVLAFVHFDDDTYLSVPVSTCVRLLPNPPRRWHEEADGSLVCPHRDVSVCPECAKRPEVVDVVGAHFWVVSAEERAVLRDAVSGGCDDDPFVEAAAKADLGKPTAVKRGRNKQWPHVPVIEHGDPLKPGYYTEQILASAFATHDEAVESARQAIDQRREALAAKLADPRYRALREEHGLPRELPVVSGGCDDVEPAAPVGHGLGRNEAIVEIKAALKRRSGKAWSVTGGSGTAWAWITITARPARRVGKVDGKYGYLSDEDAAELATLLGLNSVHHQGVSIPGQQDYRDEYVDRANGRVPARQGVPQWD